MSPANYCGKCGGQLKPGAKFCANCGTAVALANIGIAAPDASKVDSVTPVKLADAGYSTSANVADAVSVAQASPNESNESRTGRSSPVEPSKRGAIWIVKMFGLVAIGFFTLMFLYAQYDNYVSWSKSLAANGKVEFPTPAVFKERWNASHQPPYIISSWESSNYTNNFGALAVMYNSEKQTFMISDLQGADRYSKEFFMQFDSFVRAILPDATSSELQLTSDIAINSLREKVARTHIRGVEFSCTRLLLRGLCMAAPEAISEQSSNVAQSNPAAAPEAATSAEANATAQSNAPEGCESHRGDQTTALIVVNDLKSQDGTQQIAGNFMRKQLNDKGVTDECIQYLAQTFSLSETQGQSAPPTQQEMEAREAFVLAHNRGWDWAKSNKISTPDQCEKVAGADERVGCVAFATNMANAATTANESPDGTASIPEANAEQTEDPVTVASATDDGVADGVESGPDSATGSSAATPSTHARIQPPEPYGYDVTPTDLAQSHDQTEIAGLEKTTHSLEARLAYSPNDQGAYDELGVNCLQRGDIGEALLRFDRGVKVNPQGASTSLLEHYLVAKWLNRYYSQSQFEEFSQRILDKDSNSKVGLFFLAQAMALQNRKADAVTLWKRLLPLVGGKNKDWVQQSIAAAQQ